MPLAGADQPWGSASWRYQVFLAVTDAIALHHQIPELFHDLAQRLRPIVGFDIVYFVLHDGEKQAMRSIMVDGDGFHILAPIEVPVEQSAAEPVFQTQQPCVVADIHKETRFPLVLGKMREHGIRSLCVLPMSTARRRLGRWLFVAPKWMPMTTATSTSCKPSPNKWRLR